MTAETNKSVWQTDLLDAAVKVTRVAEQDLNSIERGFEVNRARLLVSAAHQLLLAASGDHTPTNIDYRVYQMLQKLGHAYREPNRTYRKLPVKIVTKIEDGSVVDQYFDHWLSHLQPEYVVKYSE